jgi:hypothetical protein
MEYKYGKYRRKRAPMTDWEAAGWVCIVAFILICFAASVARFGYGYGVDDKDIICNQGGEAYVTGGFLAGSFTRVYRIEVKDYVCQGKRGNEMAR